MVSSGMQPDAGSPPPDASTALVTMVASFDLGVAFTRSQEVIERLRGSERFAAAGVAARLRNRVQPSYQHNHPPEILAGEDHVELRLPDWAGTAGRRTTLHPSGVVTFEITMALPADEIAACTQIEEDFYGANAVMYKPYLAAKMQSAADPPSWEAPGDDACGLDLISPVEELRELLAGVGAPRPGGIVYPAIDMRTIVSTTVGDVGRDGPRLVEDFFSARNTRAQFVKPSPTRFESPGGVIDAEPPRARIRRWKHVLFASCDVDAALIVADRPEARLVAVDCAAMAQSMWFMARTWVGVLDGIGTVSTAGWDSRDSDPRDLQAKIIELSAAEIEIQASLATIEAAGIMLRDTWHVQLVELALESFEVARQRRLLDQRLSAVARNHATVAELLDRAHQNAARDQADRLQYLFSVAVAAGIASLLLQMLDLDDLLWRAVIGFATLLVVWALLAIAIRWVSQLGIALTKRSRRPLRR
jgi:hypothetical protein